MKKILLTSAVFFIITAAASTTAYAIPNYGFGSQCSQINTAVHIGYTAENNNNQDVIYIDISAISGQNPVGVATTGTGEYLGTLTIPSGTEINVYSGETMASMDKGAGHFSGTGLNSGNTALIGHNRGRGNGYFIFVKDLQAGDVLTLEAGGTAKTYAVSETHKVHATQTELLAQFGDSRLTLVTCWENEKDYRRVVVAKEINQEMEME